MIDPVYQGERGTFLQSEDRENYTWNAGDPLGDLLVFLYLIITVNEGLQPSKVRATRNSDLSGRKVGPPRS